MKRRTAMEKTKYIKVDAKHREEETTIFWLCFKSTSIGEGLVNCLFGRIDRKKIQKKIKNE